MTISIMHPVHKLPRDTTGSKFSASYGESIGSSFSAIGSESFCCNRWLAVTAYLSLVLAVHSLSLVVVCSEPSLPSVSCFKPFCSERKRYFTGLPVFNRDKPPLVGSSTYIYLSAPLICMASMIQAMNMKLAPEWSLMI